jgi:uncharacterized metal-binding protein YceD (DUF177 family)
MCSLKAYDIDMKSLSDGESALDFHVDNAFFGALDDAEISKGDVDVHLNIYKVGKTCDIEFLLKGVVSVPCDLCLDDMEQEVEASNKLVVKLGAEESDEGDVITIDEDYGVLNVSWLIYEYIDLAVPVRHVHAPGKCNPAMTKLLREHSVARSDGEDAEGLDPRWQALADLKHKN